jgi:hypothetical protein
MTQKNAAEEMQCIFDMIDEDGLDYAWHRVLDTLMSIRRPDIVCQGTSADWTGKLGTSIESMLSDSKQFFHEFIGELYERCLAYANKDDKKKLGKYFTPADVADYMAGKLLEVSEASDSGDISIVEPCCGCGGLIVPLLKRMDDPWETATHSLALYDIDGLAIYTTKIIIAIEFAPKAWGFDSDAITSTQGDFLENDVSLHGKSVIVNPPYGKLTKRYDGYVTQSCNDMYALFLERISHADNVVAITPQSFIGATKMEPLRNVLYENMSGYVIAYDNVPGNIFYGRKHGIFNTNTANSVRAAITIAHHDDRHDWKVTPMLRWQSNERDKIFDVSDKFMRIASKVTDNACWLKAPQNIADIFQQGGLRHISDLVAANGEYTLTSPTTPRYHTTAAIHELQRTGKTILHFATYEDMAIAYVTINSSVAYAWWRMTDGGITLTNKTLLSTPIFVKTKHDKIACQQFVNNISAHETDYIVAKKNAGKMNENLSFPDNLVEQMTMLAMPNASSQVISELTAFHTNSVIEQESKLSG